MNWQALLYGPAVLPTATVMQVWLHAGWSMVLAYGAFAATGGVGRKLWMQWAVALLVGASAWIPGSMGPVFWLGMAFQSPSVVGVGLCALLLVRGGAGLGSGAAAQPDAMGWVVLGMVLGWLLLADSLGLLPFSVYSCGFGALVPGIGVLCVLVPWAQSRKRWPTPVGALLLVAILSFLVLRWPTGNVWDAVLDPWLWIALHAVAIRTSRKRLTVLRQH